MDNQKYEEYAQKFQKALLAIRKLKKDLAEAKQNQTPNHSTDFLQPKDLSSHPLLEKKIQLIGEQNLHFWNIKLNTQNTPYLAQYKIEGEFVFPASGYIEIILAAIREVFENGNHTIRDLKFYQKLLIPNQNDFANIQLKIKVENTDNQLVITQESDIKKISQNIEFSFYVEEETGNWELYADGKVQLHAPFANFRKYSKEQFELESQDAEVKIDKQTHYQITKQLGIDYGEVFQGVERIFYDENVAWVKINIPKELQNKSDYLLHPAILDACLQGSIQVLPDDFLEDLENSTFISTSIASLQLTQNMKTNCEELFVHIELVKVSKNRQTFYFNIVISDGEQTLMRLFDVCIMKLDKIKNLLEKNDIYKDILLDKNIALNGLTYETQRDWKNIFLTGATGFSGAFMLAELIENTYANIHCLVRASNTDLAQKRIENNLKKQGLWKESYRKRIIPLAGDLARPRLGLFQEKFDKLAQEIDVIFHIGFLVNWVYTYSDVRAANVLGTKEIFKLATQSKIKALHFSSSIATFSSINLENGMHIEEKDVLEDGEKLKIAYIQTKWVIEKLMREAQKRGLPFSIYRFGDVRGYSKSGVSNTTDFMSQFIKGCIKMGFAPDKGLYINMLPVDYLITFMFRIAANPSIENKTFHFSNPQVISWTEFIVWMRDYGFDLEIIPFEDWKNKLLTLAKENLNDETYRTLAPIFVPLRFDEETENTSFWDLLTRLNFVSLDMKNTENALLHTTISCPSLIDDELLKTYFDKYVESGFLTL